MEKGSEEESNFRYDISIILNHVFEFLNKPYDFQANENLPSFVFWGRDFDWFFDYDDEDSEEELVIKHYEWINNEVHFKSYVLNVKELDVLLNTAKVKTVSELMDLDLDENFWENVIKSKEPLYDVQVF